MLKTDAVDSISKDSLVCLSVCLSLVHLSAALKKLPQPLWVPCFDQQAEDVDVAGSCCSLL